MVINTDYNISAGSRIKLSKLSWDYETSPEVDINTIAPGHTYRGLSLGKIFRHWGQFLFLS
jgi:hypothetical protein